MKRPATIGDGDHRFSLADVYRVYNAREIAVLALGLLATGALGAAIAGELFTAPYGPLAVGLTLAALFAIAAGAPLVRARRQRQSRPASLPADDPLARIPGPDVFTLRVREETARAMRFGGSVAVALFDVNNLDDVNRTYTRAAGDGVLRHVLNLIAASKRGSDVLARWEGDAFAVLLLECDETGARVFIERVEHALTKEPAQVEVRGRVITIWTGVCAGAAALGPRASTATQLIAQATLDLERAQAERERRRQAWLRAS
jgi:diguanylate cyclase (GGDEF)-like protein